MMKWMTITASSSILGYAGWNAGNMFFSTAAGLWLSLIGGLVGIAGAFFIIPRD